ncbi:methyl-accepting chemotaxis protein, partial [Azohydromonas lata]|uniref:methyl-accepting chemotaxis protein n=1 Tax=Azohydromonas lata TaxID=45677 RepID=UPI001470A4DB
MFKNLALGKRLALAFAAVIAVFLAVGAVSLYTGARLKEADSINQHTYVVLDRAANMLAGMVNMETGTRGFLLSGMDGHLGPWNGGKEGFDKNWNELKSLTADNPVQQARLDDIKARSSEFQRVAEGLIALRREVTAGRKPLDALTTEFCQGRDKAAMDAFRTLQGQMTTMEEALLVQRSAAADSLRTVNRLSTALGSLLAVVVAVALGLTIARSITRPMQRAVQIAEAVAAGDLSQGQALRVDSSDETGRLLAALKRMSDSLAALVGQVRSASDSIATGSNQIATGNADLSQRTEEQASNLQQTAATMEELNATVANNAQTSQHATQLAERASTAAGQGGEVVGQVVATMEQIQAASRRIADIIGTIDG